MPFRFNGTWPNAALPSRLAPYKTRQVQFSLDGSLIDKMQESDGLQAALPLSRAPGLVLVPDTPKGRGVFATQPIDKDTIVEVCPVLVFTEDEVELHNRHTCLQHYTYHWPSPNGKTTTQAIALGLGSMFNHSTQRQNVTWSRNIETQCIIYKAHRDIRIGEELCISYGSGRLWFEDSEKQEDDQYEQLEMHRLNGMGDVELLVSGLGRIEC